MPTPREVINAICTGSDENLPKMALYQPTLVRARQLKRKHLTTEFIFMVRTSEFSINDVIRGTEDDNLVVFLAMATLKALRGKVSDT